MHTAVVYMHPAGPLVALVGNPNCGKTALFNRLTGSRQKVANYAGVTVERKEGRFALPSGKMLRLLDLPGTYSLHPRSPDERVTADVLAGRAKGEKRPDLAIVVVDATNLRRTLRLALAVKRTGLPMVVALNMLDLAKQRGLTIDAARLADALGVPVVETVAVEGGGADTLVRQLDDATLWQRPAAPASADAEVEADHAVVARLLAELGLDRAAPHLPSDRIDRIVLNPLLGLPLLAVVLFFVFQAVFSWAEAPMGWIEAATGWAAEGVGRLLADGWFKSLVVDGVIAGAGGVVVFLPQIVILFFFILVLEESGYLPRAAFLLDRLMGGVGLSGRSFIPLLSSFACAIPGIMAARTISNPRDRLVTIMIAPLMTCSARLPVYALLIGAFIPRREVGGFELQGLVLFALYVAGISGAMFIAWLAKHLTGHAFKAPLMMELPAYHLPRVRNVAIGLWQRIKIFLRRVGGIILALTVLLWFLSSYPAPPVGATGPAIEYSLAGTIGRALEAVFAPIGFNWQISVSLIPGLAAREVMVGALGTVYALSATGEETGALTALIAGQWSLATALSLLAWFVFAPQCLATLATVKRETGGWTMPLIMAGYLFALAYLASFITYHLALAAGWG
ncbi:ferrous iron transporter B [Thiobacillus sp. 65-1402]|uniref:ferrous iron transporter B n=1 Tax=Thiobacillus sp. 65-1402 TaxID=1895861 RepID=UPI0009653836|nr:ferrous iron transporter B [Thiobacillus sp. 65-1402]OJW74548.1 MAG: ferrous iron transporter B [Thiobacillus sp. 65-1402]